MDYNLRLAHPVDEMIAGRQAAQNEQMNKQRMDIAGQQENRAEQSFTQDQKLKELDYKMKTDSFHRGQVLNQAHDDADKLMSVLEAPQDQQEQLFQQVLPQLGPGAQQQFQDGQFDQNKATVLVRSALSVLDRYKELAKQDALHAKNQAATDLQNQRGTQQTNLQTQKDKAAMERLKYKTAHEKGKGGNTTADYNLIRKSIADAMGATYNPLTGITLQNSQDRVTFKEIAAKAERYLKDSKGSMTPTEASVKALSEYGYTGRPTKAEEAKQNPGGAVKDWLQKQHPNR